MFGNAPKGMWEKWIPPDDKNRIPLACRCLLVREGDKNFLIETGIGTFFPPVLRERYGVVESEHVLVASLAAVGLTPDQIDVIVLSHLHFDHAGGVLTAYEEHQVPRLVFPRATYVVGAEAWQRAIAPHARDKASFIPGLTNLLEASGRLEIVAGDRADALGRGFRFHRSSGHTPGLLLTEVEMPGGPVVFAADLIPGKAWVHLPITMGYDRYPELLIEEKRQLLERVAANGEWVFYTHDPRVSASRVTKDDKGKFAAVEPVERLAWS